MAKGHIRSIRISDNMAALIEQQAGNNFTEKWENLVTRCVWELPEKERRIKNMMDLAEKKEREIKELNSIQEEITDMLFILEGAQRYVRDLKEHLEKKQY